MNDCTLQADAIVQFFCLTGCISHRESRFFLSKINCNFARIHKQPMASRPVCNLRHVWLTPFLMFVVEHLGPLTRTPHAVITHPQAISFP